MEAGAVQDWAAAIKQNDRRLLAKAITLAESTRPEDRRTAEALISALRTPSSAKQTTNSLRLAITGPPGAGKSTFIEALGKRMLGKGEKLAVLAIDPSSPVSGGSILGDKTRMPDLAAQKNCFIRPAASGGAEQGLSPQTATVLSLLDAAGFSRIILETVGVGQAETRARYLSDLYILLLAPAGGDELQGLKRGTMELADFIFVTKADGILESVAQTAASQYESAIRMFRGTSVDSRSAAPHVQTVSSQTGVGLPEAYGAIEESGHQLFANGHLSARRAAQMRHWLSHELKTEVLQEMAKATDSEDFADRRHAVEDRLFAGDLSPPQAARELAPLLLKRMAQ